jgi:hypothetical protein
MDRNKDIYVCAQLFVSFANPARCRALSHWIVEAISLSRDSKGQGLPSSVHAHSTWGVAAYWALFRCLFRSELRFPTFLCGILIA